MQLKGVSEDAVRIYEEREGLEALKRVRSRSGIWRETRSRS
jgi:hypothetical protein